MSKKIADQQEKIVKKIKEEATCQFNIGQLVLIMKTAPELQQVQTKLTNKYDHLARIKAIPLNAVTYEVYI